MTAGACRTLCGQRWSRFCRPGRGTRWAATTRECRTVRQWMRSSSCYAPGVIGMPCARPVSARHLQRIGAFRNGARRAYSQRSGARGCWPMTRGKALTGHGWHWTWLALDGAMGKAPLGGEKTGRNPTDRGKRGVKRSRLTDGRGVPLAAVIDGANRNDHTLMRQTIEAIPVERPQPTPDQPQNLCLDKGYDYDECKRGKSPGGFGDRPYRSAVGRQKLAEFRAIRSDSERMLHLRARTFAPLTILNLPLLSGASGKLRQLFFQ